MSEHRTKCHRCSKPIWVETGDLSFTRRCDDCKIVGEKVIACCAHWECDFPDDPCHPGYCARHRVELTYADGAREIVDGDWYD